MEAYNLNSIELLNETLVEKIFNQFENKHVKSIYTDGFIDHIIKLFEHYNIYFTEVRDSSIKRVSATYGIPDTKNMNTILRYMFQ